MSNRDLKYRILGDNMLGRAVGGAVGALGRLHRAGMDVAGRMVRGMSRIIRRGLQVGFAGTIAGAIWSVRDAMAVQEIESKFDAVFKNLSKSGRDWSKDFAASTKRSEYDVRAWMASIQDTLVPMGLAREEAAKLSREITTLGVDLGSFANMDAGEAIERIVGTLTGAHMNARRFGVVITEAALQQKALEMGLVKANEPLSEQAKLLARIRMLQDGTTDAQGDAVRTAGSLTNRWRGLLAAFKTWRVEVGNQIADGLRLAEVFGALERGLGSFLDRIRESKAVERWAAQARSLLVDMASIGRALGDVDRRGDVLKNIGAVLVAALLDGMSAAVRLFLEFAPRIGHAMYKGFKRTVFGDTETRAQAMRDLGVMDESGRRIVETQGGGRFGGTSRRPETDNEMARRVWRDMTETSRGFVQDRMLDIQGRKSAEAVDGQSRTEAAIDQLRTFLESDRARTEDALRGAGQLVPWGETEAGRRIKMLEDRERSAAAEPATPGGDAAGAVTARSSLSLGDVFTRLYGQGPGSRRPEEEQVKLLQKIDKSLETIAGKEGGMAP